jgi:hypothetical protein
MKPVLSVVRLGAFLALAGCANHPLDCAMGFYHSDCLPGTVAYDTVHAQTENDDAICKSYGLQFGTPEYAQCRQNAANQRSANQRAAAAAYMATRPQAAPMVPYQMPTNKTTNCTTNYVGTQAYTSCQ